MKMKNHFVPKFYFKPWLDAEGKVVRYCRKPSGEIHIKRMTPGQICYQHDLHTLVDPVNSEKLHIVEDWLGKSIDDKAAPVVEKILKSGIKAICDEEAHAIVGLILSLIVRSPENVAYLRQNAPTTWKDAMAKEQEKLYRELAGTSEMDSLPSLIEYAETRHPGSIKNAGNFLITEIISDGKYWERLINLRWRTVSFSGTHVAAQLTSDRPVTIIGTGLDDPNVCVIFPISPTTVLYLMTEQIMAQLDKLGVGYLGLWTIKQTLANARKFVFGTNATNSNLVDKHLVANVTEAKGS